MNSNENGATKSVVHGKRINCRWIPLIWKHRDNHFFFFFELVKQKNVNEQIDNKQKINKRKKQRKNMDKRISQKWRR